MKWVTCHMCAARSDCTVYTGFLVIYSLRVLKSEIRKWTVNFSSNVGIENCGLFLVRSCGSVLFYISFGSVRNVHSVDIWPIVRPHKSKGPNKKRRGRTILRPNFRRKGAEFYQNCFSPLILSDSREVPKKYCYFPTHTDKYSVFYAQIPSKRDNHLGDRIFFSQQLNFSSWLSRKFSQRVGSTVSPSADDTSDSRIQEI